MKVIAMLGGLGSQMFKYAFYLSIKKKTNDNNCYIDTSYYLRSKSWNGFELKTLFNIKADDFVSLFSNHEIDQIKRVNYFSYKALLLNKLLQLDFKKTIYFDRGKSNFYYFKNLNILSQSFYYFLEKINYFFLILNKKINKSYLKNKFSKPDFYPINYLPMDSNAYYDEFNHTSDFYINNVKDLLITTFKFPELEDKQNILISKKIKSENSVAIHVRRTDHLYDNNDLFNTKYYQNSIKYIKKSDNNLRFYLFSDDLIWCKYNLSSFGLDEKIDKITFVDWNKGYKSYIDMQLMTFCKHNVIAISSFSWWGYYLSSREKKIVCAPKGFWLEVPYHF